MFYLMVFEVRFNPITEIISVVRKKIRQKETGSLSSKMPAITAPDAPIAPQTA